MVNCRKHSAWRRSLACRAGRYDPTRVALSGECAMYELHPLPTQIDKSRLELLARAEPATIGHFLHTGFMDPGVRALQQDVRVSGTAVTVRVPGPDSSMVHYALGQVRPGDIMVVDRCGDMKHAV